MEEIANGVAMEAEQADFADFFCAEYRTLLRAMYLVSGSRDEAEDLAQDAFVKVLEGQVLSVLQIGCLCDHAATFG